MSKAILLTGTSQGIGHALTKLFLINGYRVIGTNTTGIDNINGRLSPEESAQKIFQFITSDFKTGIFWNVETEAECTW